MLSLTKHHAAQNVRRFSGIARPEFGLRTCSINGTFVSLCAQQGSAVQPLTSATGAGVISSQPAQTAISSQLPDPAKPRYIGIHHVAVIVKDLDRAMQFYQGILDLEINPDRPHDKLPYRGAWLWVADEMIHLMELPNPDPLDGRPDHGGRDRHVCIGLESLAPVTQRLAAAGIPYTSSKSGRPAIFFRDPDSNTLEMVQIGSWRSA